MPSAYRDDLFLDPPARNFAVGTPRARALNPGQLYWADWDTNNGRTDTGTVIVQGQATSRAAGTELANEAYCNLRIQADSACYFARDTTNVGRYPVASDRSFWEVGTEAECLARPWAFIVRDHPDDEGFHCYMDV